MEPRKINARSVRALQPAAAAGKRTTSGGLSRKRPAARKSNQTTKGGASSPPRLPSHFFSISNLSQLSTFCKQCIKYLQQADLWLETMHRATSTLNETGVLKKIVQNKGKNLSTSDLASLLMALMNTPLADQFLKGGSSSSSTPATRSQPTAEPPAQSHPQPHPQPQNPYHAPQPAHPSPVPAWPGYPHGYGAPPYPPQLPGYGYPPAGRPPHPNP